MPLAPLARPQRVALLAILIVVAGSLAAGAWWGFPVQDDTYMIRLLRLGGPSLLRAEHPERPVVGLLMAAGVGLAGEHRLFYVSVGVACWLLFAAASGLLWVRLFPRWSSAWPAVGLAAVAPVVAQVQYTSLTTVLPCVVPVLLVLAATLLLLDRPDAPWGTAARVAAVLLGASAAVLSEYALAAGAASGTLLFLRWRRRGALTLGTGVGLGYLAYSALGRLSARVTTDPDFQLEVVLRGSRGAPFRLLSAAWECLVGSWGRAAAALRIDAESRSTLLAAAVALAVAVCVARAWRGGFADRPDEAGSALFALVAAVVAGLVPPFLMRGYPLTRVFETRYYLPVLAFAVCATLAALLSCTRPRLAYLPLCAVAFLCADRLILGAFEEKRLQAHFDRVGESWRPLVSDQSGAVIVVTPERFGMSVEEAMAKISFRWPLPQGSRLWMMRAGEARTHFGPRSGCRRPKTFDRGLQTIRWPLPNEPIRAVFWDASHSAEPELEPYFLGCSAAPGRAAADAVVEP